MSAIHDLEIKLAALDSEFEHPDSTMPQSVWSERRKPLFDQLQVEQQIARTTAVNPPQPSGAIPKVKPYRMSAEKRAECGGFKKKIEDALKAGDIEGARALMLDERHIQLMVERAREKESDFSTRWNVVMLFLLQEQDRLIDRMNSAHRGQMSDRLDDLTARLEALEAKPQINYRGVWSASESYQKGSFISWDGSMWFAKEDSVNEPPSYDHNGNSSWVLAVKKGRPGRDAR